ncbi:MAG: succinate dehydrogenase / fumarate reductase cytochrome b subunit, partial [Granulosicoccus sp.]
MSWLTNFLFSSIGRKLTMSLTGIFLILFLTVHLLGNLQLLAGDGGEKFNLYAEF